MDNLDYIELKPHNYLKDDKIPVQEAKNIYRFRTRVAKFKENQKNSYDVSFACPLCQVQPDTQAHSVQCPVARTKVEVKGTYSDIYMEDIPNDISKTLMEISKLREDLI